MPHSLQDITQAWATWMDTRFDAGGVRFCESTKYENQSDLDQYRQNQTSWTYQSIRYNPVQSQPPFGVKESVEANYDNGTESQQSITYAQTVTTEQSFTWSITESISIGVETSGEVEVPEVAKVQNKISTKLSLSSTQGATEKRTQSWTLSEPIIIPPYSTIAAKMVVTTNTYNIEWQADVKLAGYVAVWFNDKIALSPGDYHWLWFVPIEQVFAECQQNGLIDTSGYRIVGGGVLAYASGTLDGGQGTGFNLVLTQKPYRSAREAGVQSVRRPITYTIPINAAGASALIGAGP